jgi:hypothetical protein
LALKTMEWVRIARGYYGVGDDEGVPGEAASRSVAAAFESAFQLSRTELLGLSGHAAAAEAPRVVGDAPER